ncbi:response regulator [uncultured Cyclobacterium sp.]|uniref:response regulator n=1 Tax=uncultured Cyclobacterium sp. TaxID=453820 RepID=UPI0030EC55D0|tara:strand:+ start:205508 stop:205969 length:462 start_codon:yes stop_codon:yes gene_type:complete
MTNLKNNLNENLLILADDDSDDCELFQDAITTINVNVRTIIFNGGIQLMNYLNDENAELPDILFLDLNMPIMNGFECLEEIRKNIRLKDICIIIFSTSFNPSDVDKSYALGANGYIQKPYSQSEMKNILKSTLDTDWNDPCSALDNHNFVIQA